MSGRIIAVGDIHGCSAALAALVLAIDLKPQDTFVTLGDYVDRGIESKAVLEQLIELEKRCQLVPILGNHDQMMLHAKDGKGTSGSGCSAGAMQLSIPIRRQERLIEFPRNILTSSNGVFPITKPTPIFSCMPITNQNCR